MKWTSLPNVAKLVCFDRSTRTLVDDFGATVARKIHFFAQAGNCFQLGYMGIFLQFLFYLTSSIKFAISWKFVYYFELKLSCLVLCETNVEMVEFTAISSSVNQKFDDVCEKNVNFAQHDVPLDRRMREKAGKSDKEWRKRSSDWHLSLHLSQKNRQVHKPVDTLVTIWLTAMNNCRR